VSTPEIFRGRRTRGRRPSGVLVVVGTVVAMLVLLVVMAVDVVGELGR
jgi:hypothetical protein